MHPTLLKHLLRWTLPWACASCGTALATIEDEGFCSRCWLSIPRITGCICHFCGIPLRDGGNLCFSCRQDPARPLTRAAAEYSGPLQRSIQRFKYGDRPSLQDCLGVLICAAWRRYAELRDINIIVPVPLHSRALQKRSYNQAELLAQTLSRESGIPLDTQVLIRTRPTRPQASLERSERVKNLHEAFEFNDFAIPNRKPVVLLVDDVATTLSTLAACAITLRRSGIRAIRALVLARDL